ncbi:MAG: hypothetical protein AB7O62_11475 [Pirellulales bacterium]
MQRLKILGKYWRLRFAPNMANRGDCDPPNLPHKEIRVSSALSGEERLEVLIHEFVHAAGWHIDETFVERFAADTARALWRLGYRDREKDAKA